MLKILQIVGRIYILTIISIYIYIIYFFLTEGKKLTF